MNSVSLQCLGAAKTVTGSKHLLRTPELNILVDCGLFQGVKSLRLKNREPLPVDIKDIHILLLTHAHLDHTGYIPLLVRNGFNGRILMTPPTRDLAEIILRDSAKIQEEDAERANRHGYSRHKPALPLYTEQDVEEALSYFEVHNDMEWITLSKNIKVRFHKNGHIPGSVFTEFECYGKKILFSGDIGRWKSALMEPPSVIREADYLIMESTYGNRLHNHDIPEEHLTNVINHTVQKKGNLLIPSFAVGRAQEIMLMINELKEKLKIPDVPVFLDTPMGADATDVLLRYPEWHKLSDYQCREICSNVTINRDFRGTNAIIGRNGSKIIIAGSGMLTGGRALEYLKHYIGDKRNTILLVGYQAEGTRGRAIEEGAHEIKMHGRYYPIRAEVEEISSLSAHGDQQEMLTWLKKFDVKPKNIFLVHGEPNALETFRVKIKDEIQVEAAIPNQFEEIELFKL
ncbi:MAG: MBL fold metallo-hydrolase [Nitrospirae bacterium]|nr:MBL fold metallo-hydrolase [Nitrospirota bacterium]